MSTIWKLTLWRLKTPSHANCETPIVRTTITSLHNRFRMVFSWCGDINGATEKKSSILIKTIIKINFTGFETITTINNNKYNANERRKFHWAIMHVITVLQARIVLYISENFSILECVKRCLKIRAVQNLFVDFDCFCCCWCKICLFLEAIHVTWMEICSNDKRLLCINWAGNVGEHIFKLKEKDICSMR
jgi:hypothetical protein